MTKVTLKAIVDRYADARECPFRSVLDHIGDKWTFLIFATLKEGPRRFNHIRRSIGQISQRVLTGKLRGLERVSRAMRTVLAERDRRTARADALMDGGS